MNPKKKEDFHWNGTPLKIAKSVRNRSIKIANSLAIDKAYDDGYQFAEMETTLVSGFHLSLRIKAHLILKYSFYEVDSFYSGYYKAKEVNRGY
ncbi:MAG: hypothetical protein RLN90_01560 [Balneolaceae bacterium]